MSKPTGETKSSTALNGRQLAANGFSLEPIARAGAGPKLTRGSSSEKRAVRFADRPRRVQFAYEHRNSTCESRH